MKKKQTKTAKHEETLVVFLLDRTGSMQTVKQETIGGFNGYLDELRKKRESKDIRFHFRQFDTISLDVVQDCALKDVRKLNEETYQPRGGTPLYDAIGKTVKALEKATNKAKVLFVTLTDGQENSSSEWNHKGIQALIKEKEDKDKWTFAYIGVGPEAWAANERLAAGTQGYSNVLRATAANTSKAYTAMAGATMARCCTAGGQTVKSVFGGQQLDEDDDKTTTGKSH